MWQDNIQIAGQKSCCIGDLEKPDKALEVRKRGGWMTSESIWWDQFGFGNKHATPEHIHRIMNEINDDLEWKKY